MNTLQNKKKSLSNSKMPEWFSFLHFFCHFYPVFNTLFKQTKTNQSLPILEFILAMTQLPLPLGTRLPAMIFNLIRDTRGPLPVLSEPTFVVFVEAGLLGRM